MFPTEAAKAAGGGGGLDPELVRAVLGGDRKFVSETEVGAGGGGGDGDGCRGVVAWTLDP